MRTLVKSIACLIVGGLIVAVFAHTSVQASSVPTKNQKKTSSQSAQKKSTKQFRITRQVIAAAQQRLIDLGYWVNRADGIWGESSRQGLIAFQKVEGRSRRGVLTRAEFEALNQAARPAPRESRAAHVEVDLDRQVLFVVDETGTVTRVLPVSTGNGELFTVDDYTQPAITPPGRFRVYRKLDGWRKSKLGLLYCPNYIVGGIAIHGSPSVPTKPASHGCIRIPMYAAEEFAGMTPVGTEVIVYSMGSTPGAQSAARSR